MTIVVRLALLLAACLIPGTLVLLVVGGVGRLVYQLMRIYRAPAYPLYSPSGSVLYTWNDWHRDARADYPVRYFFTERLPDALSAFRQWARSCFLRTFSRRWRTAHLIDIRGNDYEGGWYLTAGDAIFYAAFALFKKFVETDGQWVLMEPPDGWEENSAEPERWLRIADLRSLYEWWTERRAREHKSLETVDKDARSGLRYGLTQYDQYMLTRLINAREDLF